MAVKCLEEVVRCSEIGVSLSHQRRSFIPQWVETNRDSQLSKVQRVRDLGALGPKCDVSVKSLPSGNPAEEEAERV